MDLILIILGVVGVTAILVSAYVFTAAARLYISEEDEHPQAFHRHVKSHKRRVTRRPGDRRKGGPVTFPLVINGEIITADRRVNPERRISSI